MVLNRQRCLIIGSNELRNHQIQRLTAEQEEGRPAKRRNVTKCTHCESAQLQPGVQWAKCKVKHCRKKFVVWKGAFNSYGATKKNMKKDKNTQVGQVHKRKYKIYGEKFMSS